MQLEALRTQSGERNATSRKAELSDKWFWIKWITLLAAVSFIHFSTIAVAPFLHKDEFLIVELGRILLHPQTDWSIAWVTGKDQPAFFPFYLGPVVQELAYQVIGEYGPRLSGTIGALAAATMVVTWLVSRGVRKNAALVLGLVFLMDPILVQSFGLGRVDGWMIAFCIASCWILADWSSKLSEARPARLRIMLAGGMFTVAFFIWPTALYLAPLVCLELGSFLGRCRSLDKSWQGAATYLACIVGGSLLTGGLLLTPVFPFFGSQLFDLGPMQTNIGGGQAKSVKLLTSYGAQFVEVFRFLKYTPVLLLAAAVSMLRRWQRGLFFATVAVLVMLIVTKVYVHRVIYLLPYLIAIIGVLYQNSRGNMPRGHHALHPLNKLTLTVLLVWSVGISIFIRFSLAVNKPEERSRDLIHHAAKNMIGPGPHGVYSTYEFYYAGRSLGWKMYVGYDEILSAPGLQSIVHHLNYAILPQSGVTSDIDRVLKEAGLIKRESYFVYDSPRSTDNGRQTNIGRLRKLFSIPRKPYGPYQLYARETEFVSRAKDQ